jgi:hypothetical protein
LALVGVLGAVVGSAPAATGSGQTPTCQPSSTTTTTTTTITTTTTTTTPAPPPIAPPQGHPLNNVTVENCTDGTFKARSKVQVGVAGGRTADPVNFAYAYGHDCTTTGCVTIAAAFQVALVPQGARVQTPTNVALAVNFNCDHCATFAFAYQYAVDVPPGTRLPRVTRRQIASIRRQVANDVQDTSLTFPALDKALTELAKQLRADVDHGLASEHRPETHRHASQHLREKGQR